MTLEFEIEELLSSSGYEVYRRRGVGVSTLLRRYEELRQLALALREARNEWSEEF